jgi:hypothetical protein
MKKFIVGTLGAIALTFAAAPAFAAPFYVTQDKTSMKCSVSETKPVAAMTAIGDAAGYSTQADANAAMAKDSTCK